MGIRDISEQFKKKVFHLSAIVRMSAGTYVRMIKKDIAVCALYTVKHFIIFTWSKQISQLST